MCLWVTFNYRACGHNESFFRRCHYPQTCEIPGQCTHNSSTKLEICPSCFLIEDPRTVIPKNSSARNLGKYPRVDLLDTSNVKLAKKVWQRANKFDNIISKDLYQFIGTRFRPFYMSKIEGLSTYLELLVGNFWRKLEQEEQGKRFPYYKHRMLILQINKLIQGQIVEHAAYIVLRNEIHNLKNGPLHACPMGYPVADLPNHFEIVPTDTKNDNGLDCGMHTPHHEKLPEGDISTARKIRLTICGHVYHDGCFAEFLKSYTIPICPVCQVRLNMSFGPESRDGFKTTAEDVFYERKVRNLLRVLGGVKGSVNTSTFKDNGKSSFVKPAYLLKILDESNAIPIPGSSKPVSGSQERFL